MKSILTLAAAFSVAHAASAAFFADQVVGFTPGTNQTGFLSPQAALGQPSPFIVDQWGSSNLSLYNSHYMASDLTQVAPGGSLTLRLSHYARILPGVPEIGVFESVFFYEVAGVIAGSSGADSALVEVSEDGQTWYSLNSGQPIVFGMGTTYFLNSGPYDANAPASPVFADFGKPFLGTPSDLTGKSYSEAVAALDGSAGGTWLDLDGVPLSQVGYIRFTGAGTDTLELDAVSINNAAAGAAVPEPSVATVLMGATAFLGLFRRRRL